MLQPLLFDILIYVSGGLGFLVHYVIPHLRKEMPWLCCSHPLLRSHERGQFEVKGLQCLVLYNLIWFRLNHKPTYLLTLQCLEYGSHFSAFLNVICQIKLLQNELTLSRVNWCFIKKKCLPCVRVCV